MPESGYGRMKCVAHITSINVVELGAARNAISEFSTNAVNNTPARLRRADAGVSAGGRRVDAASMARKAHERGFRVDFRQRVRVATNHLGQFEPRDGCRIELADSRRAGVSVPKPRALSRRRSRRPRPTCPCPASQRRLIRNRECWSRTEMRAHQGEQTTRGGRSFAP